MNLTKFGFWFKTGPAVSGEHNHVLPVLLFPHLSHLLDSFLQFLGEMVSLKELKMTVWFKDGKSGGADLLAQVLRCVQSAHFKKCDIRMKSDDRYWCTRDGLLNIISGEAMQQWLQTLLSIPEFIISLDDEDAAFGEDWWATEITKNLPALKDSLTVDAQRKGMSIACFN